MDKSLGRILVINLPFDFSQESFRTFFSKYGELADAYIALDTQGKSRGFGFITFEKLENMKVCLTDTIIIENRPIRCIIDDRKMNY